MHIGDSRAYLLRAGVLEQLSDDHSLVGEMMRDGRLTADEAATHPHRSILSRALGTEPVARIDEFEVDLQDGDVLLLCSDGLSGPVPAEAIRKTLGRADPADAAARLIAEARKNGGPDNITAVVLRLDEPRDGDDEITMDVPADEVATVVLAAPAATVILAPAPVPSAPIASPGEVDPGEAEEAPGGPGEAPGSDVVAPVPPALPMLDDLVTPASPLRRAPASAAWASSPSLSPFSWRSPSPVPSR